MIPANGNGFAQKYSTIIQTVTVAALFIGGFWGAVIAPLSSRLEKAETLTLSRLEYAQYALRVDQILSRHEAAFLTVNEKMVPERVHQLKWDQDKTDKERIREAIERIRADLGGTYSLKDALSDMQKRLDRIETAAHLPPR